MSRRVVVTGLGMVTPLGNDVETTWEAIKAGRSGIARITQYDPTDHSVQIAAEVKDFDPTQYVDSKELRRRDRYQLFDYAAAMQAYQHSGFELKTEEERNRMGVVVGSSVGGQKSFEDQILMVERTKNLRKVTPFGIPMLVVNGASNMVSISIGATGPSQTPASACATGADCIGQAVDWIKLGRIDRALAGCGEAPILAIGIAVFDRVGACSRRNDDPATAMRPFSKDRDGLVFAEGAAVLMLEELEAAKARGAEILAEIVGYGTTSDAFHITAPEPEGIGASRAIQQALDMAQLNPEDIDYISAHGTATDLNDPMETKAVKRVFGDTAYKIPISSTKSMTGHGMGMTAALEAAFCVLAIRDHVAPPTINYYEKDPDCDLDYVPNEARDHKIEVAMTNSFGFGGHNSSLIFKKFEG
ncbi:MAG: beta-ketoacyl-[acyl-carrier-protein] synthase II [Phototrophicales bacterium]|nr:MAG: beta-ketoacyl-[acyl-carrier-protein] synthase II [Phototrophicales bacterium]RMG71653.1 MAG: beta-ketoacyl-[acyl-carrier-protein] synthase II [Chloroflexota bacterium]